MSETEKRMKVIDRRMFTPDGELREEYRGTVDPDRTPPDPPPSRTEPVDAADTRAESAVAPTETAIPAEAEATDVEDANEAGPRFTDLVGFLAQTAAAYLQQARQGAVGGAMSAGDLLEMARLQVDLLDVLERKTAGNLTAQEHALLDDARRQLRLALG